MSNIRAAREFCFQYLFHLQLPVFNSLRQEYSQNQVDSELVSSIREYKESTNSLFSADLDIFIERSIKSTLSNYDEIETLISKNLKNWKLSRLSKVDHTNLLLAVNELCFDQNAPKKVVINEAIEISKKFGSQDSSSFINGVLDSIANKE